MKPSLFAVLLLSTQCSSFVSPHNSHLRRQYENNNYALRMSSPDKSGFNKLSVTELKRLLTERGVDFRDCLEKRDLVERLENSRATASSAPPSTSRLGLTEDENRLISTFKRVSPAVAFIQTTLMAQQQQGLSLRGLEIPSGTGSGFLWDNRGHVVTNYHVLAAGGTPKKNVKVKLGGMAEARDAQVVGVEPEKDLAVLRLTSLDNLPNPIDVGTSNDLQVGQSVIAIGNPFGLDDTLTTGVISAIGREVKGIGGRPIKGCVQTDASINPGNSGGPLLDSRGRLIGVNTAIFSPGGGGNVGIGFAIPVDTVRRVVNQIIRYGRVVRPTLGINVVDDRVARSIEAQVRRKLEGVLVAEVIPGSPAAKAGLSPSQLRSDGSMLLGDLITDVNGQPVRQVEDLLSAVEECKEADIVSLRVMRGGDPRRAETIKVQLTTRDQLQQSTSSRNGQPSNGRRSRRSPFFESAWQ